MIATAPASVAVNTPILIPPMIMIGSKSGKIAGLNAFQKRDHVIFSVEMLPYPRFFEITPTNIIMVMQSNAPTPRPDINRFPMDTFAIHP